MKLESYPIQGYPEEGWPLPAGVELIPNVYLARAGESELHLDIIRPRISPPDPMPALLHLHGGGWRWGNRRAAFERLFAFAEAGYFCVASDYRLTDAAAFPAQIHDAKCAVRWIRANAAKYNVNPAKIGVWGGSSGGHLAALLGVTSDAPALEGEGPWPGQPSSVQAVAAFCAPIDFNRMDEFPEEVTPAMEHSSQDSCEGRLLGGALKDVQEAAINASPLTYVKEGLPPFYIMHGYLDEIVPVCQAELLHESLTSLGNESTLRIISNGSHSTGDWVRHYKEELRAFFSRHLK